MSSSKLAGSDTEPLVAGELFQAHWAARANFVRADADLGAHAKLAPIRKTRRVIPVNGRGIHIVQELSGARHIAGNDAVGVRRTVVVDVLDGLFYAVHHANIQDVIIVFGEEILVGRAPGFGFR